MAFFGGMLVPVVLFSSIAAGAVDKNAVDGIDQNFRDSVGSMLQVEIRTTCF